MTLIAGNRLWVIKQVVVPAASTVVVTHEIQTSPAVGFNTDDLLIIPVPNIPTTPGWDFITIGAITSTTVEFTNTTPGEGGVEITINVLFIMPHTIIGPGQNGGYL